MTEALYGLGFVTAASVLLIWVLATKKHGHVTETDKFTNTDNLVWYRL